MIMMEVNDTDDAFLSMIALIPTMMVMDNLIVTGFGAAY